MITIVHVIGTLEVGGAQMMLWKLISQMDPQRFRHVVVCAFEGGPFAERLEAAGVPVIDLRMRHGAQPPGLKRRVLRVLKAPGALASLGMVLRRVRPNLVLTWGYHVDTLGLAAAAPLGIPVVWTIFSSFNPFFGRFVMAINQAAVQLSRFPAAVVSDSEAGRAWHIKLGYRARQWRVIPSGFDLAQFAPSAAARAALRQELGLAAETPLIGLIGRYNPVKGHETFVAAAGIVLQDHPTAHIILAGPGVTWENAELCGWITATAGDVRDRLHLLGERPDVPQVTAALDIATCASYSESSPLVVGEAMASGVPCVVTDVGDAAIMVGETGLVVPPRDPAAMAAAWSRLLALPPAERRALGERARARIDAHYSLPRVIASYEALCAEVAGDGAPAPPS
ncbi:MAG: glycosyltransferase [Thermomicrobiales bacterium]